MIDLTRKSLTLAWCAVVVVMIGLLASFGVTMNLATGVLLVALSLVPPGIIFALWPSAQPATIAEVLRK